MRIRPRVVQLTRVKLHLLQIADHLQPRAVAQLWQHRLGGIEILKLQRVGDTQQPDLGDILGPAGLDRRLDRRAVAGHDHRNFRLF